MKVLYRFVIDLMFQNCIDLVFKESVSAAQHLNLDFSLACRLDGLHWLLRWAMDTRK